MTSKTLQVRIDADEYQALQDLADAAGVSISDFSRQAIRLGVAAEQISAVHEAAESRHKVQLELTRNQFKLQIQTLLLLQDLAAREGIDTDAIREEAADLTSDLMVDADALEAALSQLQQGEQA